MTTPNAIITRPSPEEIAELEKQEALNPPVPTQEQRIAQLESELKATKILMGLEE